MPSSILATRPLVRSTPLSCTTAMASAATGSSDTSFALLPAGTGAARADGRNRSATANAGMRERVMARGSECDGSKMMEW